MSELYKSKVGWVLAVIYASVLLPCLLYISLIDNKNVIVVLIIMIMTAPWGLLFMFLPGMLGISIPETFSTKNQDLLLNVEFAIGGLINAFILYLLGLLMAKAFNYIAPIKPKP